MAKKIHPKKNQTEELNRAKLEFLKRNPEERQEIEKLFAQNEKKREKFIEELVSNFGDRSKEYKESWDFLLRENFFDKDFKDKVDDILIPPAANAVYPFENFAMDLAYRVMAQESGEDVFHMSEATRREKYLDYLCENARGIFTELTNGNLLSYLFVGIDLRRSKDVILAEVENLPMLHNINQIKALVTKIPAKRLKWLSIVDELLAVWDAWTESGEPARQSFPVIAKRLHVPESTVKDRWHRAHAFIYGKKYETDPVKRREELADKALERLCLKCTKPVCKNKHGWDEEIGCPAYVEMAGKNTPRERSHENLDIMADMQVLESYLEDEQE